MAESAPSKEEATLQQWLQELQALHTQLTTQHRSLFERYYAVPMHVRKRMSSQLYSDASEFIGARSEYARTMWNDLLRSIGKEWLSGDSALQGQLLDAEDFLARAQRQVHKLDRVVRALERRVARP